jgi:hypothetical protein
MCAAIESRKCCYQGTPPENSAAPSEPAGNKLRAKYICYLFSFICAAIESCKGSLTPRITGTDEIAVETQDAIRSKFVCGVCFVKTNERHHAHRLNGRTRLQLFSTRVLYLY